MRPLLARLTVALLLLVPPSVLGFGKMSSILTSPSSVVASSSRDAGLFIETPLIPSSELTKLCNRPVYLKLDTLQASGSFKDRGMAHLCETFKTQKGTKKLISSSGGNAGLACATVGPKLGMEVSVIVPESTKPIVVNKLKSLGADVTIHGKNWNAADELARKRVEEDAEAEYVSPYDHQLLWTGHSTVVDEIVQQLPGVGNTPAMIIASVVLLLLAVFIPAPIDQPLVENGALAGDSGAPWFFLWIQETLQWGDPFWWGVALPLAAVILLGLIPYVLPNAKKEEWGRWLPSGNRLGQIVGISIIAIIFLLTLMGWLR